MQHLSISKFKNHKQKAKQMLKDRSMKGERHALPFMDVSFKQCFAFLSLTIDFALLRAFLKHVP